MRNLVEEGHLRRLHQLGLISRHLLILDLSCHLQVLHQLDQLQVVVFALQTFYIPKIIIILLIFEF